MRADRAALLLPEVIRRGARPGSPLGALLDVMEAMHAPAETALRGLPSILDPQTTPDDFVPFLATWVGLDDVVPDGVEFEAGVGRLRQLVATSAARARRRGTLDGLRETLLIATGRSDITVDDARRSPSGRVLPFHVDVVVPAAAAGLLDLVQRLVEHEKPAFVTATVALASASTGQPAASGAAGPGPDQPGVSETGGAAVAGPAPQAEPTPGSDATSQAGAPVPSVVPHIGAARSRSTVTRSTRTA